jgi:squalene-hopene/tetraprenyl-beta-curcumene cyclase
VGSADRGKIARSATRVLPMKPILIKARKPGIGILAAWFGASLFAAGSHSEPRASAAWNPQAAAAYLDRRESWWMAWPPATRDHGTFCVSCHTAVPYALARPALRAALGEVSPSENERKLLDNVTLRVRLWQTAAPFYTESSGAGKTLQSRGTESILNALILASTDARSGKLSDNTRAAFDHMWELQNKTGDQRGAWAWLNFGNEPFEAADSQYYGASLAAVAVGTAPENYRTAPKLRSALMLLGDYMRRECDRQPLIHQVVSLWASTGWRGLLAPTQQKTIVDNILDKQQPDGGWSLSSLGWTWMGSNLRSLVNLWIRSNDTPMAAKSDGYATGLIVFVLEQAGVPNADAHMQRGRSWLVRNQNQSEGQWPGYSMVNRRDPSSGTGRFMNDAATAYAVLALTATDCR